MKRPALARRLVHDLSWVLIISGVLLVLDAGVTLAWQEPLTALVASVQRGEIDKRLLEHPPALTSLDRQALADLRTVQQRIAFLARRELREVSSGEAVGRLRIPRIGGDYIVVQGTDQGSLERGPGHYPTTALPGLGETVAIAGHRTTYLAPFRHIDALQPGDRIVLRMPYGRFFYTVQFDRVVSPYAWWVTADVGYDRLILSACTPLYSAAKRIVVFARLAEVLPIGSARPAL